MIETLPADPEALAQLYRHPLAEGRPYVRANMITSLDGAATADGTSGALGGPGDRRVFQTLRAAADVVLVGAATVREEDYATPDHPALAILTRSGIGPTPKLYPPGGPEPIVLTGGKGPPDLRAALAELHRRGFRTVLAEGGPSILGALLEQGLVDELCLTIAPYLVGGEGPRITSGPPLPTGRWQRQHTYTDEEGYLYTRWLR